MMQVSDFIISLVFHEDRSAKSVDPGNGRLAECGVSQTEADDQKPG